ncbi:CRISPR-associated helicase/endonuclease Cas3 [Bacillus pseudomycoides]|uniref:CRISPR-associated helicase/endonuclease Cas3 n=1 Tax=Bacillus pseudomycoides TaxID=64104 RepID=UPI000BEBD0F2|nr:CRISPR-associated helicase/endonuclease Cas3 [Bacillus pseudomycoides]PED07573.1 CRISPR-associated helicase/endonuclease Cas3 [Bacillus pseudomycoides]PEI99885.1 CRISPR-associated helicase/endonuclease Cas3 [Bacillus pseudomycoides]PEK11356.1 CRISPR-associated helicase/endonuclease Cas3 [Bacillus pseudomycoides]PEM62104.1 CRISPR-associated helicase/endonuclease Cas3 [Bacillus pseudomycoides]PEO16509.1 CRISPR-associated helicase/endonuclease Cas3 [Bacillus pseudomycoides]
MRNLLLAKSNPIETIKEHTNHLIEQYQVLKNLYPNIDFVDWGLLYLACLYHDIGKVNTKFQNKLLEAMGNENRLIDVLSDEKEIHHGYLSVAFLPLVKWKEEELYSRDELRILCQSIFYHHTRPVNDYKEIKKVINTDLPQYVDLLKQEGWTDVTITDKYAKYTVKSRISQEEDSNELFYKYIMTKGLLNRIDYAASGHITVEESNENLFEKTLHFMQKKGFEPNELQKYLIANQENNNIIVASTGIGKTEGALFWIGNHKGFFTLPLKVSINAIYDRVINEIEFKKLGLLHSDTSSEYLKRSEKREEFDLEYIHKTKQLTLPLTVCTLDQLIDFVFLYPGFEMKLATLAYSKLVIDEIQMYNPELVAFLLIGLKKVTDIGGKFTILTATFPPVFEHFMKKLAIPYKKADYPFLKKNKSGKVIIRHKINVVEDDLRPEHILKSSANKKVLVIVNTVKKAQELYDEIRAEVLHDQVFLLHSRFTVFDRRRKEEEILRVGKRDCTENVIWITTQIVEASLDIDFDVLYTELSEVCGLLQRMGRVFRGREFDGEGSNVHVFLGQKFTSGIGDSKKSVVDPSIFQLSRDIMKKYHNTILDEETKMKLVEEVYDAEQLRLTGSLYYRKIRDTINIFKEIKPYELQKGEIPLREIENEVIIPSNVYRENEEVIQQLEQILKDKRKPTIEKIQAKNAMKEYTVVIPTWAFHVAKKERLIERYINLDHYSSIAVVAFKYSTEEGIIFREDQNSCFF